MSPTVMQFGGYRLVIYTQDHPPAHVHVMSAGRFAKFALNPVQLLDNEGFHSREIRKIEQLIVDNREFLLNAWNDYFGESEA